MPIDIVLPRLNSYDFSLSYIKKISLAQGYVSGTLIIGYAICLLYPDKFDFKEPQTLFPAFVSGIYLCFIARLITRKFGYKSGEQFIWTVISSTVTIIIVNLIITANSLSTTINPDLPIFKQIIEDVFNFYINITRTMIINLTPLIFYVIIGSFFSAFIRSLYFMTKSDILRLCFCRV